MYVSFQKGSSLQTFFTDFWFFQNKYINGDVNNHFQDDDFWTQMVAESSEISARYQNTEIADYTRQLLLTFLMEMERKQKEEVAA